MPRGLPLSEYEMGQIDVYRSAGDSIRVIANKINRSSNVVHNYLKLGENYGTKKSPGRPTKLTKRDRRSVLRIIKEGNSTCNEILKETGLNVCRRTILNIVHDSGFMKFDSMDQKPRLNDSHKLARMNSARNHMTWNHEWISVIFSDEKKFNLDGPDGRVCYWHDIRKEKSIFSKRNFGGGSLMVWGAFCFNGVLPLMKISTRMNSENYQKVLSDSLLENAELLAGENWIFQQDNASIHVSKSTKSFLESKNINLMNWPACSPDLNPIENLWGILVRQVYKNNKQYKSIDELWNAVQESWYSIEPETFQNLINSMKNRIFEVIRLNGSQTHY